MGSKFDGSESAPLANQFAAFIHFGNTPHFEGMNGFIMLISTTAALCGFALAWFVYKTRYLHVNSAIAPVSSH